MYHIRQRTRDHLIKQESVISTKQVNERMILRLTSKGYCIHSNNHNAKLSIAGTFKKLKVYTIDTGLKLNVHT